MLLDKYLPDYHFSEKHSRMIAAPAEKIFELTDRLDIGHSPIIRFLFRLRGLPSRMLQKEGMQQNKFIELERHSPDEIIIGLIGQFWKPNGNLQTFNPKDFTKFSERDFLKAVWNFQLVRQADSSTLLITETRIQCLGAAAKRKFSLYWFFIWPFSGFIRKEILKSIGKQSESSRPLAEMEK